MATLVNEELFDYLDHLESEVERLNSEYDKKEFRYEMHECMGRIINAEKIFLEQIHKSNATLAFNGNGLPTIESLRPDLETIAKLGDENSIFKEVAETYKPWEQDNNEGVNYKETSKQDLFNLLKKNSEKLIEKYSFDIDETEDGKLELSVKKKIYDDCIDRFSKKYPLAMIKGKTKYQIAFGKLFSDSEHNFFSTPYALVPFDKKGKRNKWDNLIKGSSIQCNNLISLEDELAISSLEDELAIIKSCNSSDRCNIITTMLAKRLAEENPYETFYLDYRGISHIKKSFIKKRFLFWEKEIPIETKKLIFSQSDKGEVVIKDYKFKTQITKIIKEDLHDHFALNIRDSL
ncbi:hypothetical protein COU53_03895 [Candidatus Pacearchaeota archaeon CG10_big_fil_rev_8_21_14_0_10_30_48]|nr:MAG: hypothetical protein COU53_03895 [Candidatus Pacearchaeota archaeon CG10_big_fil_rev_8_21_14_0_10_30_48]